MRLAYTFDDREADRLAAARARLLALEKLVTGLKLQLYV